ncbi:MAG: hypothetical protein D3926_17450 [Desulfobacteraceae bacterium]|nr:MAG: hypothetical protein D3926_17450 [Desulfobacteraceae bacterium]
MDKRKFQMIYGSIIIFIGILVVYRVPEVMVKVEGIESFSGSLLLVRACFYILGGLLILAGVQKLYKNRK